MTDRTHTRWFGVDPLGLVLCVVAGLALALLPLVLFKANRILPGEAAPDGESDRRWQAFIAVAEHLESNPEPVWEFAAKWGVHPDQDLQSGIATCILEHLLEHHFDLIFPRVADLARANANFAKTLRLCWPFGRAQEPRNAAALQALLSELDQHDG